MIQQVIIKRLDNCFRFSNAYIEREKYIEVAEQIKIKIDSIAFKERDISNILDEVLEIQNNLIHGENLTPETKLCLEKYAKSFKIDTNEVFGSYEKISEIPVPESDSSSPLAYNFQAAIDTHLVIQPNNTALVPTGISCIIPHHYELQLRPHSDLTNKGVFLLNSSIIDQTYVFEIQIPIMNQSDTDVTIKRGDKIAQGIFTQMSRLKIIEENDIRQVMVGRYFNILC